LSTLRPYTYIVCIYNDQSKHYHKIIKALVDTDRIMGEIEEVLMLNGQIIDDVSEFEKRMELLKMNDIDLQR